MSRNKIPTMKQNFYLKYHEYLSNCKSLNSTPILKEFLTELISENTIFSDLKSKELENQLQNIYKLRS